MKLFRISPLAAGLLIGSAAMAKPHTTPTRRKSAPQPVVVYVCDQCHVYYTARDAKALHWKDPMGDTLKKRIGIPKHYANGKAVMK